MSSLLPQADVQRHPSLEALPVTRFDMAGRFGMTQERIQRNTDLKGAELRRFYDETFLAVALQALVNRDSPQLFLRYNPAIDDFWWELMWRDHHWLDGREVHEQATLEELLERFAGFAKGVVIWDERVPATSNLAATLAGVEDLLPIRFDQKPGSLYHELIVEKELLPVRHNLAGENGKPLFTGSGKVPDTRVSSSGSAKCDVYLWMIEHLIKPGKINPRVLGYFIDAFWLQCAHGGWPINHTLTNLDYILTHRGAVFDLHVYDDEAPIDDPAQRYGTDQETLQKLMKACYDRIEGRGMIHVSGYVPWAFKYTRARNEKWSAGGKHHAVWAEWRSTEIITSYNGYLEADALGYSALVNSSFYRHFPLPARIEQNPMPTEEELRTQGILDEHGNVVPRNYYAHYVGDYDSPAWLYWRMPDIWTDEARGKVPLSWAFNPNLCQRFSIGMEWTRRTRTPNDFFVCGNSGAGYANPRNFSEPRPYSGLPGAIEDWEAHCRAFMEQWDLSVVGFVLDGLAENMTAEGWEAYARFAPDGIVMHRHPNPSGMYKDLPWLRIHGDLPQGKAPKAAHRIAVRMRPQGPSFFVFRSVLLRPSDYVEIDAEVQRQSRHETRAVDLRTLLWLLRRHFERMGSKEGYRQ